MSDTSYHSVLVFRLLFILLSLLLQETLQQQQQISSRGEGAPSTCPPGWGVPTNGTACRPCPPFFASNALHGNQCFNMSVNGQTLACGPGNGIFYSSRGVQCAPCPVQTFCPNGRCFSTVSLANACAACPPSLFSTSVGALACTSSSATNPSICPAGSGTIPLLSGCFNCSSNLFNNGSFTSCRACPSRGQVPNANSTACIVSLPPPCLTGFFRRQNNFASSCTRCPVGSASPQGFIDPTGRCIRAEICGPGNAPRLYGPNIGTSTAFNNRSCNPCPPQRFCPNGQCCRRERNIVIPGCLPCPVGSFASGFGATGCTRINGLSNRCPAGSGANLNQLNVPGCYNCTGRTIQIGTQSTCRPCPANLRPNANLTACNQVDCISGTEPIRGGTACQECLPGWASSKDFSRFYCRNISMYCGPGMGVVARTNGDVARFVCLPCAPNSYCIAGRCFATTENDPLNGCNPCPTGQQSGFPGSSMCTSRNRGWTFFNGSRTVSNVCPRGTGLRDNIQGCYNCSKTSWNNGAFSLCQPCGPGLISDPSTKAFCIVPPCMAGQFRRSNSILSPCEDCPVGTASPNGWVSSQGCINNALTRSVACGAGQAPMRNVVSQLSCITCPAGTACGNGRCMINPTTPGCPPCPNGQISTLNGAVSCQIPLETPKSPPGVCGPGTGTQSPSLGCYNCSSSSFNPGVYSTCLPCPIFNPPNANRTACIIVPDCLPGWFRRQSSLDSPCEECPAGTLSPAGWVSPNGCIKTRISETVICGPGQVPNVNIVSLGAICLSCQIGRYCPNGRCMRNSTFFGCSDCPPGTYSTAPGATACTRPDKSFNTPCPAGSGVNTQSQSEGCYNCTGNTFNSARSNNVEVSVNGGILGDFLACVPCPNRRPANADKTRCSSSLTCLAGSEPVFSPNATTMCRLCPDGFASQAGLPCVNIGGLICPSGFSVL